VIIAKRYRFPNPGPTSVVEIEPPDQEHDWAMMDCRSHGTGVVVAIWAIVQEHEQRERPSGKKQNGMH